jgi:hypothetical protein
VNPEHDDRQVERLVSEAYGTRVPVAPLEEQALLERLRGEPRPRRAPMWRAWLTQRDALSLSPLVGALATVLLLGAGMWIGARVTAGRPVPAASPAGGAQVVEFALEAPSASRVTVVGDFNGWDPAATPMHRLRGGPWTTAIAVPEGRYAYAFVIDGRSWMPDPGAPLAPDDGFGLKSSVLVVEASRSL